MKLSTAGLLCVENRKLLLAYSKNKSCFYLPGGKIAKGETATQALCREVEEEMDVKIAERDLQFHTHISAPAFEEQRGTTMEQDCFFLRARIQPVASREIGELKFFTLAEYLSEPNQAPGAIMILEHLKDLDYID